MFTAPDISRRTQPRHRGLTLLEVVVGLTILGLMSGAIYAIVSGSVEATATLGQLQAEDRRVETFVNRCRDAFAHLPVGATVELKLLESEPMRQELTLRGVSEAFAWGQHSWWDKPAVTLAPIPWPEDQLRRSSQLGPRGEGKPPPARFSVSMTVPDFFKTNDKGEPEPESPIKSRQGHQLLLPDQQGRFWLELLPEVERIEWRFYDPAKKLWVDQQAATRPPMIELRLALPGRKLPLRVLFQTNL
jgi:prepilin-type N-terminal cleavage/methylation domain-containing protein